MELRELTNQISWRSAADVALVTLLFYQIIAMLKGTRAAQVVLGMFVIFVAYVLSSALQLETLNWIISKFYSSFIIVVIVLFQDDIRRILSRFGKSPFETSLGPNDGETIINEVISAAKDLSHDRIGALIVFERAIALERLHQHSRRIDSLVTEEILVCIFQSFSPLHDGAVVIEKNRLQCASAQLPLSKNPNLNKKLGTRHSAALGISEETDAVVLVVSEETGSISIAWEGKLQRQPNAETARWMLFSLLLPKRERTPASRTPGWGWRREPGPAAWGGALWRFVSPILGAEDAAADRTTPLSHPVPHTNTPNTNTFRRASGVLVSPFVTGPTETGTQGPRGQNQEPETGAKHDPREIPAGGPAQDPESASDERAIPAGHASGGAQEPLRQERAPAHTLNETASRRLELQVRFPRNAKVKTAQMDGDALVLTDQALLGAGATRETALPATGTTNAEVTGPTQETSESFFDQTDAARVLSHLAPEDKFIPPSPPAAPPRNVTIGGVPLDAAPDRRPADDATGPETERAPGPGQSAKAPERKS